MYVWEGRLVEYEVKIRNVRFFGVCNVTIDVEVEFIFTFVKGFILCVCFLIFFNCCLVLNVVLFMCFFWLC